MEAVAPGIRVVPVRTPTLPPATHTNTYVLGEGAMSVVDPASPHPDEQDRLERTLAARAAQGERVERIVLTHHHGDHVGGVQALARATGAPIYAHPETARLVPFDVDHLWEDGQLVSCGDRTFRARHTPGHAPGHLVFHDPDSGAMIAGDMVAGEGTILLDPADGNLGEYLDSLDSIRKLEPSVLLPAHGPPLRQPRAVLDMYIAHRHQRTDQIGGVLQRLGEATEAEIAAQVYPELEPPARTLATRQVRTHLLWMTEHGLARPNARTGRWAPAELG